MAEVGCSESARLRVITKLFTPKQRGPKSSLDLAQVVRVQVWATTLGSLKAALAKMKIDPSTYHRAVRKLESGKDLTPAEQPK